MAVTIRPHNPNLWAEIMKDTAGLASFKPAVTSPPKVEQPSSTGPAIAVEPAGDSVEGE